MMLSSLESSHTGSARPKWRRTGTPRSKSGCATCRRRKLKCDEHRPSCLRCSKAEILCEGYLPTAKASQVQYKTPRILLPQSSHDLVLPGSRPSELLLTRTDVESRYLEHFRHKTASGFEGMLDWSIWNNLVIQLSHIEPFIHDLTVAIGALSKALEIDRPAEANTHKNDLSKMAKMHREFGLLKYGRAVKTMQSELVGSKLRQVLIACLLVYCFEVLLNNRHSALSHVISGHHLLREWVAKIDQERPGTHRLLSPDPITVDDELVEAFDRMDLQISTICDFRPVEVHKAAIIEGLPFVQQMPSVFNDLVEARAYLLVVIRRCHHFVATTWQSSQASFFVREFKLWSPNKVIVTAGTNIYSTSHNVSYATRMEQNEFATDISQWSRAFYSLYKKSQHPDIVGFKNYVIGTMLRIHAITTTIVTAGVLFTEEISYDAFFPQFEELFTLTTIVVDAYLKKSDQSPEEVRYFLDLGITSPLYLLVARCRNHLLRQSAIDLLRGWHVEACWQPKLIAGIGDFLMDVEEFGNEGAYIPEKSRAVVTAVCDRIERHDKLEALVQCVQRWGGPDGGPVWHERIICY